MSKGSISKKKNPTPEKGIRKNEKEEEFHHESRSWYSCSRDLLPIIY
jgi:hypothetical protein